MTTIKSLMYYRYPLEEHYITRQLGDIDVVFRVHAIRNPNINEKHLDNALCDPEHEVKREAICHFFFKLKYHK